MGAAALEVSTALHSTTVRLLSSSIHAWRSWKSAKGTGLLAIAGLALGIGSTTAIYTVVQAVLLDPLPFANPQRYLAVQAKWRGLGDLVSAWSYPNCSDFASRSRTLDSFGCAAYSNYNFTSGSGAIYVTGAQVSPAFIRSLGVQLRMGAWFDATPANLHSAVISESLWRQMGSDPAIAGKSLVINAIPYRITGVAPAWFRFPIDWNHIGLWVPLDPTPSERASRDAKYMTAFAKKKPGVTDRQVAADLTRIASELEREYPDSEKKHIVAIEPLLSKAVEYVRPSLLILLAGAAALLFIACGNVASLLLARSVTRVRETAMRVALGATAWQLAMQYVSEGILVSLAGAVIGIAFSQGLIRTVLLLAGSRIPRADQVRMDWRVLGFSVAVAVLCGILFSLAPLWQALRTSPNQVLTSGVRASASRGSVRLLRIFVVSEIALSFALVALAAVFLQHTGTLLQVYPGFEANNVTYFDMYVPHGKYGDAKTRTQYQTRLLAAIQRTAGIESAGFASDLPLSGNFNDITIVPDHRNLSGLSISEAVRLYDYQLRYLSPGFLSTLRVPIKSGAGLSDRIDPDAKVPPVLISQMVARKLWPHQNPIGHILNLGDDSRDMRIAGVVGDVKENVNEPSPGHIYVPYQYVWPSTTPMHWAVRSNLPLETITREIHRAVASVDPQQSISASRPLSTLLPASVNRETLQSVVVSFFGAAALLLSVLGIYGVVSYSVRQRIPEMGTRLALGATGNQLIGLVLSDVARMAVIGSGIGLLLVFACMGTLTKLNAKIEGAEPFLISFGLIAAAAFSSSAIPALIAGRVAPASAIGNLQESMISRVRRSYGEVTRRLSTLVGSSAESHNARESAILADIAESARNSDSFNDAIQAALITLTERLGASSAALLVRRTVEQPFRLLSTSSQSSSGWTLPVNSLLVNRLAHYYPALPITAEDLDVLHRWAQEEAVERAEEIATLCAIGPAVAVPVEVRNEILGLLFVSPPAGRPQFEPHEMRLLRSISAQLALMVENSRLTDRIVEQERLKRDLALASEVQQRLFPAHPPEVKLARLAGYCLPARGVGGDYYDFLRLNDDQIGIALADVAGKGVAAALVMSIIQASLRSIAGTDGDSPAKLATKMNRLLCGSTGPSSYATFFYAKFDEVDRTLCYVNGGHNPPFLLRNDENGTIEELAEGGMIIGMFPPSTYSETQVGMRSGDVLMAFTDGVSEAHNPAEEEFGEERLKDLLRRYAHLPIDEISAEILRNLKIWMADAPQHDDLTFILMKIG